VLGLEFSSVKIGNMSGVRDSGRVSTSSNISDKLDACVVVFESTTELYIVDELDEAIYGEE
jgi:hypothetical protein